MPSYNIVSIGYSLFHTFNKEFYS